LLRYGAGGRKSGQGDFNPPQGPVPKIHDIGELLSLLDQSGEKIPEEIWRVDDLTQYAVETRYPGPAEPVTQKEYREAVKMAERVVKWAGKIILAKR
jgi:HEPN domain-containing protein